LLEYVTDYYGLLAEEAEVVGTKAPEYFEINNLEGNSTEVKIYEANDKGEKQGNAVYARTFKESETDEVRIYGIGGNDSLTFAVHEFILGSGTLQICQTCVIGFDIQICHLEFCSYLFDGFPGCGIDDAGACRVFQNRFDGRKFFFLGSRVQDAQGKIRAVKPGYESAGIFQSQLCGYIFSDLLCSRCRERYDLRVAQLF
jgi:hypothetical protein